MKYIYITIIIIQSFMLFLVNSVLVRAKADINEYRKGLADQVKIIDYYKDLCVKN